MDEDDPSNSLVNFFASQPRFWSIDLSVSNKYGQKNIIKKKTFRINSHNLLWVSDCRGIKPTLPVYKFEHNFYWKGVFLMPIYHYSSVDHAVISYSEEELTPFVKVNIFPRIFGLITTPLEKRRQDHRHIPQRMGRPHLPSHRIQGQRNYDATPCSMGDSQPVVQARLTKSNLVIRHGP